MSSLIDDLEEAFSAGHGTSSHRCELCGVYVFCTGDKACGYQPGEIEELRKEANARPEKYQEFTDCDGISIGEIGGKAFVIGHDCKELEKYARFLWEYRVPVIDFLKKQTESRAEEAAANEQLLKGL